MSHFLHLSKQVLVDLPTSQDWVRLQNLTDQRKSFQQSIIQIKVDIFPIHTCPIINIKHDLPWCTQMPFWQWFLSMYIHMRQYHQQLLTQGRQVKHVTNSEPITLAKANAYIIFLPWQSAPSSFRKVNLLIIAAYLTSVSVISQNCTAKPQKHFSSHIHTSQNLGLTAPHSQIYL